MNVQHLLLAGTLTLSGTLSGAAFVPSQAADPGGCFMVDESGKTINLGSLCGYGAPSTSRSSASTKATPSSAGSSSDGSVIVPISRRSGRTPVIKVLFNDSKTYEMILDTGASGTLVTRKMARELNLKQTGEMIASIADGSTVRFPTGRVESIAVAQAEVKGVDVAIAEDMEIGLLGHDFFGNYDIRIGKDVVEFTRR